VAELVVWRHGRSEWNVSGRFQGQLDSALDAVGRAQAALAASALAAQAPSVIVSSDSSRAFDTAALLAAACGLEVTVDKGLREVDLGEWSGLTRAQVEARFPEQYADWLAGRDARPGGGETYAEAGARAAAAVLGYLAGELAGPVVAVTHGGTGRSMVMDLLGLPPEPRSRFAPLGNARWAELRRIGDGWSLLSYNVGPDGLDSAEVALDAEPSGWRPGSGAG
jgi:probable phosphoglycerate mutase